MVYWFKFDDDSIGKINQDSMFDVKFGFYETCAVDQILKWANRAGSSK